MMVQSEHGRQQSAAATAPGTHGAASYDSGTETNDPSRASASNTPMPSRVSAGTGLGLALILLGIAQINTGIRAADSVHSWVMPTLAPVPALALATLLWFVAQCGLVAAGFGLVGVSWVRPHWRGLMTAGLVASALEMLLYKPPYTADVAILDAIVLIAVIRWGGVAGASRPMASRRMHEVAGVVLAYFCVILFGRPWYLHWGADVSEWVSPMPGDGLTPAPAFNVTRAITVQAPVTAVWPWLAQMGQDRAGFYSYDWLERLLGFDVHNSMQVVPEWQHRELGDLVPAAPQNFLGGIFGPSFGWRVGVFEPNRLLGLTSPLMSWQFFVRPIDRRTTRLLVRTRGNATPRPGLFFITIGDFLALQPVHFVMEHKMMVTIKARAEAAARAG